jgi:hypothetical protein
MNSRRQFLITAPLGVLAATSACSNEPAPASTTPAPAAGTAASTPAGMPPAFGTGPVTGPEVTPTTFAEAEKLMQVTMRPLDREVAARAWPRSLAPLFERRTGPRRCEGAGAAVCDVSGPHRCQGHQPYRVEATGPHRCHNPGNEPCVVLWVITPPSY